MALPEYTAVPAYPPGEGPPSSVPPPALSDAAAAMSLTRLFPAAVRAVILRSFLWLVGLGVPVILFLWLKGAETLAHLGAYLLAFAGLLCAAIAGVHALSVIHGGEEAFLLLLFLSIPSGLVAAVLAGSGSHPAWALLGAAAVLAFVVTLRVLNPRTQSKRPWAEGEVAHVPAPGNEAILTGLGTTDRTDLKRRRRMLEVAVSQNLGSLERLERELARDAGLVLDADVETLREIVRRDLAALRCVAGVFTERFGAADAVAPEKVDV
ncbi:hypothetical protein Q8F55_009203 [Vanrija albida]|uniref:FUSC family protein n=1 Tax=Vanrija albida TaxID=181172 RepID=A0ABR3PT06_9TREE